jgi:predicted ATPase
MHYFYDFKGFKNAQINLLRPMTLLIGRNGSGKTNVIEGVELLSQLANGRPLYEISDIGRGSGGTFEIRGGLQGCMRKENNQQPSFELGFSINSDEEYKISCTYQISIDFLQQPKILNEKLIVSINEKNSSQAEIFNAYRDKYSDILTVSHVDFSLNHKDPTWQLASDCSVLSRYYSKIVTESYKEEVNKDFMCTATAANEFIKEHLMSAFVFDIHPHLMRQYERIGASQLNKDGSNLSAVLYGIKINDENKEESQRLLPNLLNKLKQLPEEPFIGFEFITTVADDVLLALKCEDGVIIDARLLSDGTLRALAILTALETIPEHSRMVIEELDNGVHPSRVKLLVDTIWECSHRRNLNVLVTTHNPAALNGLTPEQLDCVVVCHYDPIEKADKLTALPDIPYSDVLLQKGSLGDLVTRNVLESYLMPNFEAEQQRKAQEWLDLF